MSGKNDYLKAISSIEETEGVIYPRDVVEDLSILGFDSKFVTVGCPEHIYCRTSAINFDWHYESYYWYRKENKNYIEPLEIYKKFISRPYEGRTSEILKDEQYIWHWRFMYGNQGNIEWLACYNCSDDVIQIYALFDDGKSVHCGSWEEFKNSRLKR